MSIKMIRNHKGQFAKGYSHTKFYPKTYESWLSFMVAEGENRTIQRTIRSDAKMNDPDYVQVVYNGRKSYKKITPSTCICHMHRFKGKQRPIMQNLGTYQKNQLSRIFNLLDPVQRTHKRIKDRLYHQSHKLEDKNYHREHNKMIKKFVIAGYSSTGSCSCCGCNNPEVLAIDHINGNGNNHRKILQQTPGISSNTYMYLKKQFETTGKWPSGFQVLCMNCNWVKHVNGSCNNTYHSRIAIS